MKLAGFKGKGDSKHAWVNPKIRGETRERLMRHQKTFLRERAKGASRTEAIQKARRAEHMGLTKKQIQRYEGKLGALARHG